MAQEIFLPKFDQSMEEGMIVSWLVRAGDQVEKGQIICEIDTDKAVVEVESTVSGTLRKIIVEENQTVPVKSVIAIVGDPDEEISEMTVEMEL